MGLIDYDLQKKQVAAAEDATRVQREVRDYLSRLLDEQRETNKFLKIIVEQNDQRLGNEL